MQRLLHEKTRASTVRTGQNLVNLQSRLKSALASRRPTGRVSDCLLTARYSGLATIGKGFTL